MRRENIRNSFIERSGILTSLNLQPEAHLQGLVCVFLEAESSTGYSFISWLPEGESIQLVTTRWWTGGQFHSPLCIPQEDVTLQGKQQIVQLVESDSGKRMASGAAEWMEMWLSAKRRFQSDKDRNDMRRYPTCGSRRESNAREGGRMSRRHWRKGQRAKSGGWREGSEGRECLVHTDWLYIEKTEPDRADPVREAGREVHFLPQLTLPVSDFPSNTSAELLSDYKTRISLSAQGTETFHFSPLLHSSSVSDQIRSRCKLNVTDFSQVSLWIRRNLKTILLLIFSSLFFSLFFCITTFFLYWAKGVKLGWIESLTLQHICLLGVGL